jgi:hypothetical protein
MSIFHNFNTFVWTNAHVLIQLTKYAHGGKLCTYIQFNDISNYDFFVSVEEVPLYLYAR